jgi:hypothetical protein
MLFNFFIPFSKVEEWMRNDVKGTGGLRSIVFVLPRALEFIRKANLKAASEESVRQLIKGIKDATSDYRSRFRNTQKKICCVRIPREVFSPDLLKQLDLGKRCMKTSIYLCSMPREN